MMPNFVKTNLFLVVLLLFSGSIGSQIPDLDISFDSWMEPYQPLENAIPLTDTSQSWFYLSEEIVNDSLFSYGRAEEFSMNQLTIDGTGLIARGEFMDIYSVLSPLIIADFENMEVVSFTSAPPGGNGTPLGQVYYKMENQTHFIEYRNVTGWYIEGEDDTIHFDMQINFTVAIRERDGRIRFHYGPFIEGPMGAQQMEDLDVFSGISITIDESSSGDSLDFFLSGGVGGDPSDPNFNVSNNHLETPESLNALPSEGQVYEYSFERVTSAETASQPQATVRLSPNPGNDRLRIDAEMGPIGYKIYSSRGEIVASGEGSSQTMVKTDHLRPGMYWVEIRTKEGPISRMWIKQ